MDIHPHHPPAGDRMESPLTKGTRGLCSFADIAMHLKVAAKGLICSYFQKICYGGN